MSIISQYDWENNVAELSWMGVSFMLLVLQLDSYSLKELWQTLGLTLQIKC